MAKSRVKTDGHQGQNILGRKRVETAELRNRLINTLLEGFVSRVPPLVQNALHGNILAIIATFIDNPEATLPKDIVISVFEVVAAGFDVLGGKKYQVFELITYILKKQDVLFQ